MEEIKLHQFAEKLQLRGYSQRTVKDYGSNLSLFCRYLKEKENLDAIDKAESSHLKAYMAHLSFNKLKKGNYLATKTVRSRLLAVKSYYSIMHEEGLCPVNLGSCILMPKARKRLPRNLPTEQEMLNLLNVIPTDNPIGIRDRCMLEIFYATGIRNQELRNLTLEDFDRNERTLFIRSGKGGKDRVVPIGNWVMPYMLEYLEVGRPAFTKAMAGKPNHVETNILFTSRNGKLLNQSNLGIRIRYYAKKAGIKTPVTPHTLRHTCATHMLRGGADIRYVQELLGHASLSSTQIYTKVAIGDLQDAHRKYHPRDKAEETL